MTGLDWNHYMSREGLELPGSPHQMYLFLFFQCLQNLYVKIELGTVEKLQLEQQPHFVTTPVFCAWRKKWGVKHKIIPVWVSLRCGPADQRSQLKASPKYKFKFITD